MVFLGTMDAIHQEINRLPNSLGNMSKAFDTVKNATSQIKSNVQDINRLSSNIQTPNLPVLSANNRLNRGSYERIKNNRTKTEIPEENNTGLDFSNNFIVDSLVGNIIGQGIGGAIQRVKEIGQEAIDTASSINEIANVINVVFGEDIATNKIEGWAKTAIDNFGLTELQAKEFAGTMGSILSSNIKDDNLLTEMSTTLAALAGDIASFNNLDPEAAFLKLRSGMVGETEPLKDLGINMTVAALDAFALQQGIEKTTKEMSEAEKVMLRYAYILEHTSNQQGDFARTSNEYANTVRTREGVFKSFIATIASGFLPIMSVINKAFINIMRFLEPFFATISDGISTLFEWVAANEEVRDILIAVGIVIGGILVSALFTLIGALWSAVKAKLALTFTGFSLINILKSTTFQLFAAAAILYILGQAFWEASAMGKIMIAVLLVITGIIFIMVGLTTLGIGLIIGAILLLVIWIIYLWNTSDEFRTAVITGWANVVFYIKSYIATIILWWQLLTIILESTWNSCVTELVLGIEWLKVKFQNIFTSIQTGIYNMGIDILQNIEDIVNGCIDLINSLIKMLNKIPLVHIDLLEHVTFDTIGKLQAKVEENNQEIENRNKTFDDMAKSRREFDEKVKNDKIKNVISEYVDKIGKYAQEREDTINGAANAPKILPGLFGGEDGEGNGKDNPLENGLNGIYDNINLNDALNKLNPGGLDGTAGTGGTGGTGSGAGKKSTIDRVNSVGKIDDPIEIDAIEVLLELSRDRYGQQYNNINPNIAITINRANDDVDAEDIAKRISVMMEESLAKMTE